MRRFYIAKDQISMDDPQLTGSDAHHVCTVLRLRAGDQIVVFDGSGNQYQALIKTADRKKVKLVIEHALPEQSESPQELTLAQGFLKDKKMDLLVRQLTELGVTRLIPYFARRSVPSPDPKRLRIRYQRWEKIAHEAMKQCGRSRLMALTPATSFEHALEMARPHDLRLLFWENITGSPSLPPINGQKPTKLFIMIGPEGGFDPAEVEKARAEGFITISMGPRILRAETAALAATALVQFHFGDMGQKLLDNPEGV
jgi:16S rRNA (uracil1498-N3)-methyltransferase